MLHQVLWPTCEDGVLFQDICGGWAVEDEQVNNAALCNPLCVGPLS